MQEQLGRNVDENDMPFSGSKARHLTRDVEVGPSVSPVICRFEAAS